MVKEIRYTNIRRVLDNLKDHPMLSDLTLEQAVRHTIRFIGIHGYPKLYQDKKEIVDIHEFRGVLPCDLISIIQVKDTCSGICMRSMTDNFTPGINSEIMHKPMHNHRHHMPYIPPMTSSYGELAFKTQGRIIFTSFPEGSVEIAYKSIPVDEDGFPLLIDNENYLACLEAYIKKQVFTVKFDQGKLSAGILQNVQQEYAWLAGQLSEEFSMPSVSEMESLSRYLTTLIKPVMSFDNGFRDLGNREYIRKHDNRR